MPTMRRAVIEPARPGTPRRASPVVSTYPITDGATLRIDEQDGLWVDVDGHPSLCAGGGRWERREVLERHVADLQGPLGVTLVEAVRSGSRSAMCRAYRAIGR